MACRIHRCHRRSLVSLALPTIGPNGLAFKSRPILRPGHKLQFPIRLPLPNRVSSGLPVIREQSADEQRAEHQNRRVNSLQTARREELRIDSVNLAEGGGMAVVARASERITPPNRSVSAK